VRKRAGFMRGGATRSLESGSGVFLSVACAFESVHIWLVHRQMEIRQTRRQYLGGRFRRRVGDDGDGIRKVHINTTEGMWTGTRYVLRPFAA